MNQPVQAPRAPRTPALLGAAVLVAIQGLTLVGFGVLELTHASSSRVALAVTTALFFVALGAGLLLCARGLATVQSWARSPVVAAQLIELLTAFSFWGGQTTPVAVVLALVAVAVLACVFHPASTRALAASDDTSS